ncbi:MAG: DUF3084 domain-containing protein [Cyanobacteria bacterium P01_A01_bin.45]
MDAGYILIIAVLILGGVIATVGDRIGTRVGKKRLSLFNLRPKKTAVLVTIFTGIGISASTLGILFLVDDGLRKGVFELEDIQKDLKRKREQLKVTEQQKNQVEQELEQTKEERANAQQELKKIDRFLQKANTKQKETQKQLNLTITKQAQTQKQLQGTRSQLGQVVIQYRRALKQLQSVYNERNKQLAEIKRLQAEREKLYQEAKQAIADAQAAIDKRDRELAQRKTEIQQRDRELSKRQELIEERDRELSKRQKSIEERDRKIAQLDNLIQKRNLEIGSREKVIAQREALLKQLEKRQNFLQQQLAKLGQSNRDFRLGKLALFRGQVLAAAVVRVQPPLTSRQVVLKLLQDANRNAKIELTEPGSNPAAKSIIQLNQDQIKELSKRIGDGREYVMRVFSAGNYVRGEKNIDIFTDTSLNQRVFYKGEVLATINANPQKINFDQLQERIQQLIYASEFRARNAGIWESIQIDTSFIRFLGQIRRYNRPVEIRAVAAQDTYTSGPLKVTFLVISDGQIIFST